MTRSRKPSKGCAVLAWAAALALAAPAPAVAQAATGIVMTGAAAAAKSASGSRQSPLQGFRRRIQRQGLPAGQIKRLMDGIERLSRTAFMKDKPVQDYQLVAVDGRIMVRLVLKDRSIILDPDKDQLIEFTTGQDGNLKSRAGAIKKATGSSPADVSFGPSVTGVDFKEKLDPAMQAGGGAAIKQYVRENPGKWFDNSWGYGNLSIEKEAGRAELYRAPRELTTINPYGSVLKGTPKREQYYWKGQDLYYVDKTGRQTPVGYMAWGTGGKALFFHGGAFPPDKSTGRHAKAGKLWTLFTVDKNGKSTKLGLYDALAHDFKKEHVYAEKDGPRLALGKLFQTETVYEIGKDARGAVTLRSAGRADLLRYGTEIGTGKYKVQHYVDVKTGTLLARYFDGKKAYIVRTRMSIADLPKQVPKGAAGAAAPGRTAPSSGGPAFTVAANRAAQGSPALRGREEKVAKFLRNDLFPKADASWVGISFETARRSMPEKGRVSLSMIDDLLHVARESKDDALRSAAIVGLGAIGTHLSSLDSKKSAHARKDALWIALQLKYILTTDKRIVRNDVPGRPSYQEAAAYALMRMGETGFLKVRVRNAAISSLGKNPAGVWAAYALAQDRTKNLRAAEITKIRAVLTAFKEKLRAPEEGRLRNRVDSLLKKIKAPNKVRLLKRPAPSRRTTTKKPKGWANYLKRIRKAGSGL